MPLTRPLHIIVFLLLISAGQELMAQVSYSYEESPFYRNVINIGMHTGVSQYFGELNQRFRFSRLHPELGFYARKKVKNQDISFKAELRMTKVSGDDKKSKDSLERVRNLDFKSMVYEGSLEMNLGLLQLQFPSTDLNAYLSLGVGLFAFNPYTQYEGKKVKLRPLGTEGQYSYLPNKPLPYKGLAFSVPVGIGVRSSITKIYKVFAEAKYHFTNTGYLDDVHGYYAGYESFQPVSNTYDAALAAILQDRSRDIGFGLKGTPRGNGSTDAFFTFNFGVEVQIWQYVDKYRLRYQKRRVWDERKYEKDKLPDDRQ
jgi:hypothetical protein